MFLTSAWLLLGLFKLISGQCDYNVHGKIQKGAWSLRLLGFIESY